MPTHAEVAARLLRSAALIFDEAGKQNPPLRAQMAQNRRAYEAVATLVEKAPLVKLLRILAPTPNPIDLLRSAA